MKQVEYTRYSISASPHPSWQAKKEWLSQQLVTSMCLSAKCRKANNTAAAVVQTGYSDLLCLLNTDLNLSLKLAAIFRYGHLVLNSLIATSYNVEIHCGYYNYYY